MPAPCTKKVIGIGLACLDQVLAWESINRPVKSNKLLGYTMQGGGMTATAMVTVARLGGRSEFWGAVGSDRTGAIILDELASEGVDISQVRRVKGVRGPVNIVCVHAPTGERYFFNGSSSWPRAQNLGALARLRQAGCLLLDNFHSSSARRAAQRARRLGIPVVGDFFSIQEPIKRLLPYVDFAIVPEDCARALSPGKNLARAARSLKNYGAGTVIITRGARGLCVYDGERFYEKKAYHVTVVDTTGAGDTFHGAFCFGLIKGLSLEDNLSFASATAALKCGKLGGRTGIPTLTRVIAFLKQHERAFNWPEKP